MVGITSDLDRLIIDLGKAPAKAAVGMRAVIKKGAANVKADAQRRATGIGHAPDYPKSISFDLRSHLDGLEAIIGPDKDLRQGALGNILEYGTSKNEPRPHLGPALERETPAVVKYTEQLAGGLL